MINIIKTRIPFERERPLLKSSEYPRDKRVIEKVRQKKGGLSETRGVSDL